MIYKVTINLNVLVISLQQAGTFLWLGFYTFTPVKFEF